ncbi:hypothetical protein RB195_001161 [Necator americanus]|uniref:Uncharacterized protein n=1 Tax=Necator americanus TaxID=51031 RepID=A0ABR1DCZ6_NECAM
MASFQLLTSFLLVFLLSVSLAKKEDEQRDAGTKAESTGETGLPMPEPATTTDPCIDAVDEYQCRITKEPTTTDEPPMTARPCGCGCSSSPCGCGGGVYGNWYRLRPGCCYSVRLNGPSPYGCPRYGAYMPYRNYGFPAYFSRFY